MHPLLRLFVLSFLAVGLSPVLDRASAADRPNIVWIVSEDNSIHYLRHFFEGGAETPAIEALANHGLTFDHAFSNAPVCSVARTTLATMCYAPRLGMQYHRRYQLAPMPEGQKMVSQHLKDAGYYTSNNSKNDYNADVEIKDDWDESSKAATWRNRPDSNQPFFHMQSHTNTHESSLHFKQESYENDATTHDPATVKLAPYHPDTDLFRYTHARYLDNQQIIDGIVADTVAKLKEDGVLEDTLPMSRDCMCRWWCVCRRTSNISWKVPSWESGSGASSASSISGPPLCNWQACHNRPASTAGLSWGKASPWMRSTNGTSPSATPTAWTRSTTSSAR
jgi:uncharacterized sulfatase